MTNNTQNLGEDANRSAHDYSCPGCGGPLKYLPERCELFCEYCGKEIPLDGQKSKEENDFFEGQKEDNEWSHETKVVHCANCGADNVIDSSVMSITCPFCGSNQVVDTQELAGIKPHRIIPFKLSNTQITQNYFNFIKSRFFLPKTFRKKIPNLKISGVYLPVWTFDSFATSSYDGELGEHYTVRVGSGKNAHTEVRVRYFHINGVDQTIFDDLLINAGKMINQKELMKLAPFNTNQAIVYDKRYLAGFASEHYQLRLNPGWEAAKVRMNTIIKNKILGNYIYDEITYLNVNTSYNNIKYKYVLIPIWIGTYQYGKKSYYFLGNGESGKIIGNSPVSKKKILILVLVIVAVIILAFVILGIIADNL